MFKTLMYNKDIFVVFARQKTIFKKEKGHLHVYYLFYKEEQNSCKTPQIYCNMLFNRTLNTTKTKQMTKKHIPADLCSQDW